MSTVLLHIGRGKTGTSALQRLLSVARPQMLEVGLHYVLADEDGLGFGHQNFARSFVRDRPYYMEEPKNDEAVRRLVWDEIANSSSPRILLSSENFTLADIGGLKSFLASIPGVEEIQILFFVRSQDELAESQYNQLVKLGHESDSFHTFLETRMEEVDFFEMASSWAGHFGSGRLTCGVYDARAGDVWGQFVASLGLNVPRPIQSQNRVHSANESVGYLALAAIRFLNMLPLPEQRSLSALVNAHLVAVDLPALLFEVNEAAAYRERFAASNVKFSQKFLGQTKSDLGGRRYDDLARMMIRNKIRDLRVYETASELSSILEKGRVTHGAS